VRPNKILIDFPLLFHKISQYSAAREHKQFQNSFFFYLIKIIKNIMFIYFLYTKSIKFIKNKDTIKKFYLAKTIQ